MSEYDINWFFENRKLRRIPKDQQKIKKSLEIARLKLEEAKKLFSSDFFNNAVLSAYTSMFHAARALLYKDGIQEKSHYAVYFYIKEKFFGKIPNSLLFSFDSYRDIRHELLYGYLNLNKKDAENAVIDSEDFLEEVRKILENE